MLKKPASGVLASLRPSTYPQGYAFGPSLAAALLDSLFEHPATVFSSVPTLSIVVVLLCQDQPAGST